MRQILPGIRLLRVFLGCLCTLLPHLAWAQTDSFIATATDFLTRYSNKENIGYAEIKKQPEELYQLTRSIAEISLSPENGTPQFWILAYTLFGTRQVVQRYPITTIKQIPGFFSEKRHRIAGRVYSLKDIQDLLIAQYGYQAWFALPRFTQSSPPLQLDSQVIPGTQFFEEHLKTLLLDPTYLRIDSLSTEIMLHGIFLMFMEDLGIRLDELKDVLQLPDYGMPHGTTLSIKDYNWELNAISPPQELVFQPYQASLLLASGYSEIKSFNSIRTQTSTDGFESENSRSTFFSSFTQIYFGADRNLNWGLDFVFKSNLENTLAETSPLRALQFENADSHVLKNGDTLRNADGKPLQMRANAGLAHIGAKIKFNPVRQLKNLALQQTVYLPIELQTDGRYLSFTQLFYDKSFRNGMQLFVEGDAWLELHPNTRFELFAKLFLFVFPTRRTAIYLTTTIPDEYGLGMKYFISPSLEVELLYTYLLAEKIATSTLQPMSYNLGLRYAFR